jgi:hypothetical protein
MQERKPLIKDDTVSAQSNISPTPLDHETVARMIQESKDDVMRRANEQLQKAQDSSITIIGIFSSIFSFLTIEFQILNGLSDIRQTMGLSLLLFAMLLSFNLALDYIVARRFNQECRTHYFLMLLVIMAFSMGLLFLWQTSMAQDR